jgi:hypothetical protein
MKLVPSFLLAVAIAVTPTFLSMVMVDGAAIACDGICEFEVGATCEEMLDEYIFSGDCCSLQEADSGNCTVVTTTDCYFQVEGETGCVETDDGVACVVPGIQMSSNSGELCPDSDYEVVLVDDDEITNSTSTPGTTPSPVAGGPTAPVAAPTDSGAVETPAPAAAPTSSASRLLLSLSPLMVVGGALLMV